MSDSKIDLAEFEKAAGTYALADMDIRPLILLARAVLTCMSADLNTEQEALAVLNVLRMADCFTDSAEVTHG